jgi:hypothetical protein
MTPDEAVEGLAAVLAEAAGERGEEQWRWVRNALVERGLRLLPTVTAASAHAREFPGLRADQIRGVFEVADAVIGRAGPGDPTKAGTLLRVYKPAAMDLSSLPGQEPGTVMFPPGTWFEATADATVVELRARTVELRNLRPADGMSRVQAEKSSELGTPAVTSADLPAEGAASRPQSARRSVQYHPLATAQPRPTGTGPEAGDDEPPPESDGDTGGAADRPPPARRRVLYQPGAWTGDPRPAGEPPPKP